MSNFGILLSGSWDPDRTDARAVREALERMVSRGMPDLQSVGVEIKTSQFRELPKAQEGNDVSVQSTREGIPGS